MFAIPLALALILAAAPAKALTLELAPVKDNTLYENSSGALSNGSGQYLFAGKTNGGSLRRALLAFDLSSVPAKAQLTRVALTLTLSKTISGAQTHALHRVLAAWGEGSSNAGDPGGRGTTAAAGDATWLHTSAGTSFWAAPGGDYWATPSASQSVSRGSSYTWESAQMLTDAQAWIADPTANFGWILLGNEAPSGTAKRFDSREASTASKRPRLTIEYTLPNTPPTLEALPDQTIDEDGNSGPLPLTLGDAETSPDSLTLSARADNALLLPASGIALSGSGANRVLTLNPAPDQYGSATLTLAVFDGSDSTSRTFALQVNPVNDPPAVATPIPAAALDLDRAGLFSIDLSSPAVFADPEGDTLSYQVSSSDTSVVAASLSGQVLSLVPRAVGDADLTLSADDGKGGRASTAFSVSVTGPAVQVVGDFDGDLSVGFEDFFLFADHFGETSSSPGWNPLFDLAANDTIDFEDFFLFADHFGAKATP